MKLDNLYEDLENDYILLTNILSKDKNLSLNLEEIKEFLSLNNYISIALHHKFDKSEILITIIKLLILKKKNTLTNSIINKLPENLTKNYEDDINQLNKLYEENPTEFKNKMSYLDDELPILLKEVTEEVKNKITSYIDKDSTNLSETIRKEYDKNKKIDSILNTVLIIIVLAVCFYIYFK